MGSVDDLVDMLSKELFNQFVSIHIVFPYPAVGFRFIAFPLDKVIGHLTPWFPGFSPDLAKPTVKDFFDFIVFGTVDEIWWWQRWLFLAWESRECIWSEECFVKHWVNVPIGGKLESVC